jgi:predicted RNA-binding protein YlxR (DUF448 family)
VACRRISDKREVLRFVRGADGRVVFDPTGRVAGRGAYVCASPECLEKAQKTRGLERALKIRLSDDDYQRLAEDLRAVVYGNSQSA